MESRLTADLALKPGDLVWDVGGFEGGWSEDIRAIYGVSPHIFEPIPGYAAAMRAKGLEVEQVGLGDHAHEAEITIAGDRSSTFPMGHEGSGKVRIRLLDVSEALGEQQVAVCKLNIEGGEYGVLERLLACQKMRQIGILLVQFHTFVPEFGERYLAIRKGLKAIHDLVWRDPFVWERWDKM